MVHLIYLIHLSIYPSVRLSIHLSDYAFIYLSIYPYIHISIHLFIDPFRYLSIYHLYINAFTDLYIYLSIYPSIHLSISPSIYPYLYLSISTSTWRTVMPPVAARWQHGTVWAPPLSCPRSGRLTTKPAVWQCYTEAIPWREKDSSAPFIHGDRILSPLGAENDLVQPKIDLASSPMLRNAEITCLSTS